MITFRVIPDPFTEGRWLACRVAHGGWMTAESSHLTEQSANGERDRLLAAYVRSQTKAIPDDPHLPRQLVLGFYTDADANL